MYNAVFALSCIASQNVMQIQPSCDSKCHMRRTYERYKINHRLFDKKYSMLPRMAMD